MRLPSLTNQIPTNQPHSSRQKQHHHIRCSQSSRGNGGSRWAFLTERSLCVSSMSELAVPKLLAPCSHCRHFFISWDKKVTSVASSHLPFSCSQGHGIFLWVSFAALPSLAQRGHFETSMFIPKWRSPPCRQSQLLGDLKQQKAVCQYNAHLNSDHPLLKKTS